MSSIRGYLAVVSDSVKWSVEDAAISARLAEVGYAKADMEAMQSLLQATEAAYNQTSAPSGDQVAATRSLAKQLERVKQDLSDVRAMMVNNLKRADPLFIKLGLNERRPSAQDDLLSYAVRVFTNGAALSTAEIAPLARRKWDAARFKTALDQATEVQALNDKQEAAKAAALAATAALYDKIDALDAQFRPFAKDARRALAKMPGALDKLQLAKGVPAKPTRPAAKNRRKPATKPQPPKA